MKKAILLTLLTLLGGSSAFAQLSITGTVTSAEDRSPLPFVTVLVKGTSTTASTGNDGSYTITVPNGEATLVFTFVGMLSVEEPVGNRNVVNISMSNDASLLDEAIVWELWTI